MTTLTKTLTLLLALGVSACAVPEPNSCAGWRPVYVQDETIDYLASRDPAALKALIGHQETGGSRGCW